MALLNCAECGHSVSDGAKSCPHCGTLKFKPPAAKKKSQAGPMFAAVFLGLIAIGALAPKPDPDPPPPPKTAAEIKAGADKTARLRNAGAGAMVLKKAAKDPAAFELTSTVVKPDGTACYEYRAKNSFGAVMPGTAVKTTKGKMLVEEHDGNAFVGAWNKSCVPAGGDEIAPLLKNLGIV